MRITLACALVKWRAEAEIILTKAYLAEKDYKQAEGDAGHLLGEIYLAMGDKKTAREWIKKAVKCRKKIKDPKVKGSEALLEKCVD